MSLFLDKFKNSVFNQGGPAMRDGNQSANPGGESISKILEPGAGEQFYIGLVVRAGAGTYDVAVKCLGGSTVTCSVAQDIGWPYFGVTDCTIPAEGSRVLVYMASPNARYGTVVCVIPSSDQGEISGGGDSPQVLVQSIDLEPKASAMTEAAHEVPWVDGDNIDSLVSHGGRPHDIFPGNKAWFNEQGVGLAILNLMMQAKATERCKIELGLLDDMLRIVSGYYRHQHSQGETAIYNDEGRLTQEMYGTSYQEERDGQSILDPPNFMDTGLIEVFKASADARFDLMMPNQDIKKRFQLYTGFLGDIVNFFVANPAPDAARHGYGGPGLDEGLMHMHIDSSGRCQMRSACGFSFERWDRIPIPKKIYEPWDPQGDKDLPDPGAKDPFEFDEDHPYGRNLQLRDAMAWRNKSAYQRLHEQSRGNGFKDYDLPNEGDLPVPRDEYDELGQAEEKFEDNAGRRAYFNIEDDGSIIMRDAWGSEIVLRGGNIILNCAGQVEVRSGKSIINMAGHDIIQKARKSVDITARDRDVRIKANVNLHMLSEGRSGPDAPGGGGILLESRSTNSIGAMGFDGNTGEDVLSTGISIIAKDSAVFTQGKVIHQSCQDRMILEGKDPNGGVAEGELWIACKNILATADNLVSFTSGEDSGILLTSSVGCVYGPTALVAGGGSLGLFKGSKIWIPLMEADAADVYSLLAETAETLYDIFQVEDDWLMPFLPSDREDFEFTYRSSVQYGTDKGTEVYKAEKFYMYRPMWAQMLLAGHRYIEEQLETWEEYAIEDTYVWPGEEHYEGSDGYVVMDEEVNLGDSSTEMPKGRNDVDNKSGEFSGSSFHEYEVVRV